MQPKRRATIKDVAKRANVSLSTASMALNGKDRVSEQTSKKVLAAAQELNYYRNDSARSLRMSKTNAIGLILPDITNLFYSEIVEHIRAAAERQGYFLLLGITANKAHNEKRYVTEFIRRNVDGVIMSPMLKHHDDVSHIRQLQAHGIPLLFLGAEYAGFDVPCVMCDLTRGAYEMTSYLLGRGLRKIALITADKRVDNHYILGYSKAHKDFGLPWDPQAIFESDFEFSAAVAASEKVLDWQPDAIFTISDLMACAAVQAARNRGIAIPRELSIAGYDDVLYASINQTPITTVRQPIGEMCLRSMELLSGMMEQGDSPSGTQLLPPELVIRATTR